MQVKELHLKIQPETPLEERERWEKVNEASSIMQDISILEPNYDKWYQISLAIYEKLLATPKMKEVDNQVQECDQKSAQLRALMMMLPPYVHRIAMQEISTLVQRDGEMCVKQQDLLNKITLLQTKALQVNEQVYA